jgi:hypothetical protein
MFWYACYVEVVGIKVLEEVFPHIGRFSKVLLPDLEVHPRLGLV